MEPMALFWAGIVLGIVGFVAAAYAAKRQGRAPLAYVRLVLSFLFLIASYVPISHLLALWISGDARLEQMRLEDYRFYATFLWATLLGLLAVATLFIWRPIHLVAGVLFFGTWAGTMFVDILGNALAGRVFRSVPDALAEYGFRSLVLALAVAGLIIEFRCRDRE
jgi:hypothetical protein